MRGAERLFLLLLVIVASSVAIAASWQALVSPAPLSPKHKSVEGRCDACHLVFSGVPNEKCLACHEWIVEQAARGEGFHAKVRKQSCQTCHLDHQGDSGRHTSKEALAAFSHDDTTFSLRGAHTKASCKDCHKKPAAQMTASCTSCHKDTHDGELGTRCGVCHDANGWNDNLKKIADHETRTDGGHTGLSCKQCHAGGRQLEKPGRCINCHESDNHGGIDLSCEKCHQVAAFKPAAHNHDGCTCEFPGKHQTFGCLDCHKAFNFANTPTRCSGCHAAERKHEPLGECSRCHTALDWKDNRFDHNGRRSRFELTNRHLEVACSQCHDDKDARGRTQFRAAPTDCVACHQAKGDEAHGDFGDCATCHDTTGFERTSFDHEQATGFPLSGRHGKVGCQSCHAEKTKGYPSQLPVTPDAKAAKKKGASWRPPAPVPRASLAHLSSWLTPRLSHGPIALAKVQAATTTDALATDEAPSSSEPSGKAEPACVHCHQDPHEGSVGTSCASCHSSEAWLPSTFTVVRHQTATFALEGEHESVRCSSCHVGQQLKGLPLDCAGCHVDKHRGKLGQSCQSCHTTSGFTPVPGFEHQLTGFELTKQHAAVSCADCHGQEREKDLTHVASTLDCKSCHVSGHATFELDCVTCHLPEDSKLGIASGARRVDHRDTGFPLVKSHALLSCKSCHAAGKPTPMPRCASCHQEPHGGNAGIECADCHQPDRWSLSRFNHDRAGWSLRGRHFLTPCASCHTNQRWVGLRTDCFDCHALDAARARATVGGHAFGPSDCRDCHRSLWQW